MRCAKLTAFTAALVMSFNAAASAFGAVCRFEPPKRNYESGGFAITIFDEAPTSTPTATPTSTPAARSTATAKPTASPTPRPTETPTASPTPRPTETPTASPTPRPTEKPTASPTPRPTEEPTETPTPTDKPSESPSPTPTATPTDKPSESPSPTPTIPAESPTPTIPAETETPSPTPTAEAETEEPGGTETETPSPSPGPGPSPSPSPEPAVRYDDGIITAYAGADSYMTAAAMGINIAATDFEFSFARLSEFLSGDPYVGNRSLRTAEDPERAMWTEPDIVFGNQRVYSGYERHEVNPNKPSYIGGSIASTADMLAMLEDTIDKVKNHCGGNSLSTRRRNLTSEYEDDGIMGDPGEKHYSLAYKAYDYYNSVQAYVAAKLTEINHAKRTVAVVDFDNGVMYGDRAKNDVKGTEFFGNICENIVSGYSENLDYSLLETADVIVSADFENYSADNIRRRLESAGVASAADKIIIAAYPPGVTGVTNNSLESLVGFAYCAGTAYHDLLPDLDFNPVALSAYFYYVFFDMSLSDAGTVMSRLMGGATLPDRVSVENTDFDDLESILEKGHSYYLENGFDVIAGQDKPVIPDEEINYGDFFEDGEINIADAVYLISYLSLNLGDREQLFPMLSETAKRAADCDCDGQVLAVDYMILMNYLNGTKVHYTKDNEYSEEEIPIELPYRHSAIE